MNAKVKLTQYILHSFIASDDFADRLNNQITGILLIFFIGFLFIAQYIYKPIQCWVPQEFSKPWEEYAEYYCWVTETYWLRADAAYVPKYPLTNSNFTKRRGYYQWVPFVLMLQCLAFYVPYVIWHVFQSCSSMNVDDVLKLAAQATISDPEQRQKLVLYVSRCIEEHQGVLHDSRPIRQSVLHDSRPIRQSVFNRLCAFFGRLLPCLVFSRRIGNFLCALYIIIKMLYIFNLFAQLYFIGILTGTNYTFYGIEMLQYYNNGSDWQTTGLFPRLIWCEFTVWSTSNQHTHAIQCVLPINISNEKIYIFLWFWFLFVLLATLYSLLAWMGRLLLGRQRQRFICKYLKLLEQVNRGEMCSIVHKFVEGFLCPDGVFVIRLLSEKAGDLVAGDVVCHLWHLYKERAGVQGGASMSNQSASGTMANSVGNPGAGHSLNAYHHGHGHFHKHSFAGADTDGSMKPDGKEQNDFV